MSDQSLDRRGFVAGVLGASGVLALGSGAAVAQMRMLPSAKVDPTRCSTTPRPFKPGMDKRPITMRRTVEQLAADSAWLAKMHAGYKWMRSLPASDPRSLVQQGNIHKIMCAGGPREVHQSDRFLAWHRCFVYFQERIAAYGSTGGVSLDPTFRLAVWDWEGATTTPTFPVAFTTGSLVDPNRQPTFSPGDGDITAALATNDVFTLYGNPVGGGGGSPVLENASHGQIHVDTGFQTPPYHDMGALPTAALDPVFCAHHGNIDKVWAWWQQLHGNKTPNSTDPNTGQPYDPAWIKNVWYFYDYDGKCYSIGPADVIDYRNNLRYVYPPAPGTRPIRVFPLALARAELRLPPEAANATAAPRPVSMVLRGVQVPAPGTGRFDLVATVNGRPRRVGHFALFSHPMTEGITTNVLARIDPAAAPVLKSGASWRIVPERAGGTHQLFGVVPPAKGAVLQATSATLLVE
ncbi:MAG: tyrosinase family protein [Candidatus Eremiobacteraeota bacterium]|nr:tyrosinase family protein [Candidatus Eremiobacteraeota bacterium]